MEGPEKMLAKEALWYTRMSLQEKLPYLSQAFSALTSESRWSEAGFGTNGVECFWEAGEVLELFDKEEALLQRRFLHLMLHGLYLHMFREYQGSEKLWWLACDLLTEYRIDRMNVPGFARPIPDARGRWYRKLREEHVPWQERPIARWLAAQGQEIIRELTAVFRTDRHERWRQGEEIWKEALPGTREELSPERMERMQEAVHRFRTAFEQLNLRVEEHKRQAGGSVGTQVQRVELQKEQGYDYRRFLRQFAVSGEELCLDMDSFDYIPYDYSRRMYDRLVFLEPLEYREVQRLQELVIAIDTSGSCSGEVVRRFLQETWEIFSEKEMFFHDMSVHVIQCDCLVQEHVCIESEAQWEAYVSAMEVKGHGDTDFTPVFRLVDRLIAEGTLRNLKGLLYFTDGDGIYPSQKPEYETAFVFLNEKLRKGRAPDWALQLTLDREAET